jgi:hypothetical protein
MAFSLLVLLVPIFVLLVVYRFLGGESPTLVDPTAAYSDARVARAFPVAEAAAPPGWQTVSSAFRRGDAGAVLRVGFRSSGGATAQLVESNVMAGALISAELGAGAHPDGDTTLGNQQWHRYIASRGDHALVLSDADRTVIVVGRATDGELAELAASLH